MTPTTRYRHQRRLRRAATLRVLAARHSQTGRIVHVEPQHLATALMHAGRP